jgi:hypothetical protein
VLSLGASRRFLINPRSGGRSIGITLGSGGLIVMGDRTQRDWLHCVPKQTRPAGPRVSALRGQNAARGRPSPTRTRAGTDDTKIMWAAPG